MTPEAFFMLILAVTLLLHGNEASCLTFSRLSCTEGSKRGLSNNSLETRLIPTVEFNCSGTIVGWTVSGRSGSGIIYPQLQIWRRDSSDRNTYHKIGREIQIDALGTACETIAQTCGQKFHCRLAPAYQVNVQSRTDIIGVELPPLDNQAFELFFTASSQRQYVWRHEVTSRSISIGTHTLPVYDDLFLQIHVDVNSGISSGSGTDKYLFSSDGCEQAFTNTNGLTQCSCINGYTLSIDGRSCFDIYERLSGIHDCQQSCMNMEGGCYLLGNTGYQLLSDNRTCSDTRGGSSMSCLMTGAAVGGAIAPPLLTIILFLVALICVLRRSGKRNKHEITIQRIPPSMESSLTDVSQMQAFMAPPLSDVNHIYDSIKLPDVGWPQRLQ